MNEDTYRQGVCEHCGCKGSVFADNGLCGDCDSSFTYCTICQEDQFADSNPCRHVFMDDAFEWFGSGVDSQPNESVESSLFKLFGLMPEGFVPDLRQAILSQQFHTFVVSGLVLGPTHLYLRGMRRSWSDEMLEIGERRDDEIRDGYHWLASLYNAETADANATTIKLIDEWLAKQSTESVVQA